MPEEVIVILAYFAMGLGLVSIVAFMEPITIALLAWGAARSKTAEARLLEAKNEAARLAQRQDS